METILEQQRRYHEEKERLMDAKTKEMLHKKSTVGCSLYVSISITANQNQKYLQINFKMYIVSFADSYEIRSTPTTEQERCWT